LDSDASLGLHGSDAVNAPCHPAVGTEKAQPPTKRSAGCDGVSKRDADEGKKKQAKKVIFEELYSRANEIKGDTKNTENSRKVELEMEFFVCLRDYFVIVSILEMKITILFSVMRTHSARRQSD
jgi:hypothetical protein